MKTMMSVLLIFCAMNSYADVSVIEGRVAGGLINPDLAPFGAIVNLENGEVLYVTGLISVLAPNQLDRSCIYRFSTIPNESTRFKSIQLVPPTTEVSCGHQFPADK